MGKPAMIVAPAFLLLFASLATPQSTTYGRPNLLFWEIHADLGGPIIKDKAWFFGAYNHFKIDKAISGVEPTVATDIGIFDNYTAKLTFELGERDRIIGYSQWGRNRNRIEPCLSCGPRNPPMTKTRGPGFTRRNGSACGRVALSAISR